MPKSKKKKKHRGTQSDIQPTEEEKVTYSLDDFINWIDQDEIRQEVFKGVKWDSYRTKENWMNSLQRWNTLRVDRLDLLNQWRASLNNNHD